MSSPPTSAHAGGTAITTTTTTGGSSVVESEDHSFDSFHDSDLDGGEGDDVMMDASEESGMTAAVEQGVEESSSRSVIDDDAPAMPSLPGDDGGRGGSSSRGSSGSRDRGKDTGTAEEGQVAMEQSLAEQPLAEQPLAEQPPPPSSAGPSASAAAGEHSQPITPRVHSPRSERGEVAAAEAAAGAALADEPPASPHTPAVANQRTSIISRSLSAATAPSPSSQIRTPVATNKRKSTSAAAPATPATPATPSTPATPATPSSTTSSDFWTDFTAASTVAQTISPAVEETRRAVRNIFYTTRDRASGTGGGVGTGGGDSRRRLKRPDYVTAAAAASTSAVAASTSATAALSSSSSVPTTPVAARSLHSTGSTSTAKGLGSPSQNSPSVRRMGRPGRAKKYVSVGLEHDEHDGGDGDGGGGDGGGSGGGGSSAVHADDGRKIAAMAQHDGEDVAAAGTAAAHATASAFTIDDGDDDGDATPDSSAVSNNNNNSLKGARSASIDSVGDVLKDVTGGLSPDTVGSQSSRPGGAARTSGTRANRRRGRRPENDDSSSARDDGHVQQPRPQQRQQQQQQPQQPPNLGNLSYPDGDQERRIVESFWRLYDDHVILSIFGILGIFFRILASTWFRRFDDAFNEGSALFTNLPLNCLSCFIMGGLCSGDEALKILYTRAPGFRRGDKKHDGDATSSTLRNSQQALETPHATTLSQHGSNHQHEGEFVFRQSGGGVDDYVQSGGRPRGTLPAAAPSAAPIDPLRRRTTTMDRIRAGGRNMILEVITGGTPDAADVDPDDELREVQLMALERRIRASKCLVLFPAKKEDIDVMAHYFEDDNDDNYSYEDNRSGILSQQSSSIGQSRSFESLTSTGDELPTRPTAPLTVTTSAAPVRPPAAVSDPRESATANASANGEGQNGTSTTNATPARDSTDEGDEGLGLDRMVNEVTENLTRLTQVDIAEGWDVGTTPEAMSEDLLLGLRVGFCGCLSTFSSWNSSMINLLWNGHITQAIVGYAIGIQLPIISYRAGQYAAVYWFVWRRRREVKRAERRGGYGLRLRGGEYDSEDDEDDENVDADTFHDEYDVEANFDGTPTNPSLNGADALSPESAVGSPGHSGVRRRRKKRNGGRILLDDTAADRTTPSVRAIATAVFLLIFTLLINSLFFLDDTQTSISLLFSPLGVLTRWRLLRLNKLRPGFPLGTFACNMLGCALSGSLGSLLAGNPGPEESMVVQSMIQGFAGSLSSLAAFVVELLSLIDPIIFKYDGLRYAVLTICWALVVGFITSQAKDWADKI